VLAPGDLQDVLDDGLDVLLDEYNALDRGFKRRERLDVKKPGPYFSTNNYAFRRSEEPDEQENKQVSVWQNMERASGVICVFDTTIRLNCTYIKIQSVPRSKHSSSRL
jgi:hypothetical protein